MLASLAIRMFQHSKPLCQALKRINIYNFYYKYCKIILFHPKQTGEGGAKVAGVGVDQGAGAGRRQHEGEGGRAGGQVSD